MKSLKHTSIFIFLFSFSWQGTLLADDAELSVGVGLLSFDYAEYDDSHKFLDGETGFIPGVIANYKINHGIYYSEWHARLHGNIIDYDGQTQGGTPLKTKSDALIIDTHYKYGAYQGLQQNHAVYVGLGFRYWMRNIRPGQDINGNPVAGLLEHYYWFYSMLGYTSDFVIKNKYNMGVDIRLTRMMQAKMDVNFLGYKNYDNTQVNLGDRTGLRIALPVTFKNEKQPLTLSVYYEMIDIGRSNNVRVTSNGVPTAIVIYEPRSETRNIGLELTWLW